MQHCCVERHYLPRLSGGYKNTALVSAFMYSEVSCISDPEAGPFQAGFRSERSWVRVRGLEWGSQPDWVQGVCGDVVGPFGGSTGGWCPTDRTSGMSETVGPEPHVPRPVCTVSQHRGRAPGGGGQGGAEDAQLPLTIYSVQFRNSANAFKPKATAYSKCI